MERINVTPEMTVGAVVAEYPVTMHMLEALGIDYCCGGKQTLKDANGGADAGGIAACGAAYHYNPSQASACCPARLAVS